MDLVFLSDEGADLRLEVGLLWCPQDVCRGDVQVEQDLPEGRPVPGLALPEHGNTRGWDYQSLKKRQVGWAHGDNPAAVVRRC